MSLVSIVDNLISGLIPEANSSASNAQDVTAAAEAKLQDDVTKGLAGEADSESSSADTFVSSSDAAKSQAAEVDANLQANETKTEEVKASIAETDENIQATDSEISSNEAEISSNDAQLSSAKSELTNAEALLAVAQAAAAQKSDKGAEGETASSKNDSSNVEEAQSRVQAAQQSVSEAEQKKEELDAKKEELEAKKEELEAKKEGLTAEEASLEGEHSSLEAQGESVEADAQSVASGAESVIGEANGTIEKTNEYVASEEAKKEAEGADKKEVTNDELIDAADKENPAAEGETAAPEANPEPKFEVTINGKPADVKVEVLEDGTYNIISNDTFGADDNIVITKDGKEVDINSVSLVNNSTAKDEPAADAQVPAQPAAEEPAAPAPAQPATKEPAAEETTDKELKAEDAVPEQKVEDPKAQEVKTEEPAAEQPQNPYADNGYYQLDAMTRINEGYTTDAEMAEVIVYDMYNGQVTADVNELVGMSAEQAVASLAEAAKTEAFSNSVYTTKISKATDNATVEENQKAISEFVEAYNEAADTINTPNVEFLSLTDKSNYEAAEALLKRIDQGQYIITKNIESATMSVKSIQVSAVDTQDVNENKYNAQGNDVLSKLQGVVTEDKEVEDNLEDDILTKNEYKEMENFFKSSDDKEVAYDKLVKDAKKYGIFASQIAA